MSTTPRPVTVGLDGSHHSLAAAEWAARESLLRGVPLRLVHAWQSSAATYASMAGVAASPPDPEWSARLLSDARAALTRRHPGLLIAADRLSGEPTAALVAAAADADMLVLGSHGPGRTRGFLLGSVSQAVIARATRPVVLIRADADGERGDVVVGVDLGGPDDAVVEFAFDAASRRAARLRVVHGGDAAEDPGELGLTSSLAPHGEPAERTQQSAAGLLGPWREKYPDVEVTEQTVIGRPASHLVDASQGAALLVVGTATPHTPVGPHIGPVTHAVLQHAAAPVAVVPHA
ncbi:universal stress protein [Streptomyces sp. NPDC050448]|uniref:universal stress protein n=1 Tax=Streptomyces sp. NPDC050448 TaxID=3155404 RepID=UPI003429D2B6